MKRLFCLILIIPLFLCSCGKKNEDIPFKKLSFGLELSYNNSDYSLNAEVYENGKLRYNVLAPQNISGLELSLFDNECKVNFLGMERELPIEYIGKSVLNLEETTLSYATPLEIC